MVYIENAEDEESIISLGVTLDNLGCVYFSKGTQKYSKQEKCVSLWKRKYQ